MKCTDSSLRDCTDGEHEIVLLGLTPAGQHTNGLIGFLRDWNRMKVAITQSKSCLIIFGNLDIWR